MQSSITIASQRPAIPTYILRGHSAPLHTLLFLSSNQYLASGDSEGWVVIWSLATKRSIAVWKAHDGGITGIKPWEEDRLITHGRDHKLLVWHIGFENTSSLSTKLPVDGATDDHPKPWLLHVMDISALNFCTFATCPDPFTSEPPATEDSTGLLIATASGLDSGGIDIFQLPSQHRISQISSKKSNSTGMAMAIKLFYVKTHNSILLISGYEDGQAMIHRYTESLSLKSNSMETLVAIKVHSQPILSLDLSPSRDFFITSSADAQIVKIAIPDLAEISKSMTNTPLKSINTKHAGQQGLSIRSDGKIFATAGWDARVRVYSTKSMRELAVLKWHKDGCYTTALAEILNESTSDATENEGEEIGYIDKNRSALDIIKEERSKKAQRMHWLAAGGKDGKISLWDIY